MPDCSKYDLNFRPETYWEVEDPAATSGEDLPRYKKGETEIARIVVESVLGNVISIRARRKEGRIYYRMVEEYGGRCRFEPRVSKEPLTMGELIEMINGAWVVGGERSARARARSLPEFYRVCNLDDLEGEATEESVEGLRDVAVVESDFYPELEAYYREEAKEWVVCALEEVVREQVGEKWMERVEDAESGPSVDWALWESWEGSLAQVFGDAELPGGVASFIELGLWDSSVPRVWDRATDPRLMLRLLARCEDPAIEEPLRVLACRTAGRVAHMVDGATFGPAVEALVRYGEGRASWEEVRAAGTTITAVAGGLWSLETIVEEPVWPLWRGWWKYRPIHERVRCAAESAVCSVFEGSGLESAARTRYYSALAVALERRSDEPDEVLVRGWCDELRALVGNPLTKRRMQGARGVRFDAAQAWEEARDPQTLLRLLLRVGYEDRAILRMFACWCARQTGILNEGKVWRGIVGAAEELARNGVGWLRMKEALVEGLREFGKEIERLQDRKQGSDRELLGMAAVLWTGCSSEWAAAWYAAWESAGAIAASGDGTRDSVEQLQAARLREMIGKLGGSGARGRRGLLANELRRVKSAFGP